MQGNLTELRGSEAECTKHTMQAGSSGMSGKKASKAIGRIRSWALHFTNCGLVLLWSVKNALPE